MALDQDTLRARTLKRYNVIVAEAFEQTMGEILSNMAARQRPYQHSEMEVDMARTN